MMRIKALKTWLLFLIGISFSVLSSAQSVRGTVTDENKLPMPGVSSNLILDKMTNEKRSVKEKDALLTWLSENETELLIISGAGDVDALVEPIRDIVINQK